MENLERHGAYLPVFEDTLSTWSPITRRATEVVNILWVLKKKYIDGLFEKYKARAVYDGRSQKAKSSEVLESFAPAVRHTTHKLLVANASVRGRTRTTLSSSAYVMRLL